MSNYELTLVLDGKAGVAQKKKMAETLESLMKVFKGKLVDSKDWGVKEMAYKIGKSSSGLYLFFEIELAGENVKALIDKLRVNAEILRYLVVSK